MKNNILIIDDDKELCQLLKKCVEKENLGTSIEREAGNEIEITCNLNITEGTAKLVS